MHARRVRDVATASVLLVKTIHPTGDTAEQVVVPTLEVSPLPSTRAPAPDLTLRARLVATDAAAITLGWTSVLMVVHGPSSLPARVLTVVVAVVTTSLLLAAQHLYRTITCSLRSRELRGLARSCAGAAVAVLALPQSVAGGVSALHVAGGALLTFVLLSSGRSTFNLWLRAQRSAGRFTRPVVLVGDNAEAAGLLALVRDHGELGYEVRGYIGRRDAPQMTTPWLGDWTRAAAAVTAAGATGALVATSALDPATMNRIVRQLLDRHVHVRLSCGLRGVTQQRLIPAPLAHEPTFYVKRHETRSWHPRVKRAVDVALATTALLVLVPVLGVIAIAIKLDSPGPVLFRQRRAGRGSAPFVIYKFRTMAADAEASQALLRTRNERTGPLFKLAGDPRVTRVGRLLRASSLDELPQLWNVVVGSMSLVGPRPLPVDEAAAVLEHVPVRAEVAPGLTGLWQVEARDNPSFGPLQRLDTYYVENLSIAMDIRILASTVAHVSVRSVRALRRRSTSEGSVIVLD